MTGRNTPLPDSVLHLLKEAGVDEDPALLEAVRDIAELAERPALEPSAELAQLMANGGNASGSRRTKGRIMFIGGALAVSMGVGMSGVAAGPVDRHQQPDGSSGSVTRYWARDHVDRITPLAGPGAVAPASSDDAVPAPADGSAPGSPGSYGGPSSGGMLGADTSGVGAGLLPALPAAHSGATLVPSPNPGVTVPSASRQPAPGSTTSTPGTPASGAFDAHASDARASGPLTSGPPASAARGGAGASEPPASVHGGAGTSEPRVSEPRGSEPQDGAGTSVAGAGDAGGTSAPGVAQIPRSTGDLPRSVEEPVRFATLAWVNEGPDESMSDEAPPLTVMRMRSAAPDNIVFLSQPMDDDGPWLALFIADDTATTWVPGAEEHAPEFWEYAPETPGDAAPSIDGTSGLPGKGAEPTVREPDSTPDAFDGASDPVEPSTGALPEELSQEPVGTAPKPSGSDAAPSEEEPARMPGHEPAEDASGEDRTAAPVPAAPVPAAPVPAAPVPAGSVESVPVESIAAEPAPTPGSAVPADEPSESVATPAAAGASADEPAPSESNASADEPSGAHPEPTPREDSPTD